MGTPLSRAPRQAGLVTGWVPRRYARHEREVGPAEALRTDATLGLDKAAQKGHQSAWYARHRQTRDGTKHRGRLELITWEGTMQGQRVGFACKQEPVAVREAARFARDFEPRGEAGVAAYFDDCRKRSPFSGTESFRWTCCGMSHANGHNGCDHHKEHCLCDFCAGGAPFGLSGDMKDPGAGGAPSERHRSLCWA